MATFPIANPDTPANKSVLEMTRFHLQQATELAGQRTDLIPALIVALALNKQTVTQHRDVVK